ncbi:MAG: NAD-binding protein [Burkholderiaceae bacterium]|nr:NAD-binding protein [Burkholderiaceae bacterium]
MQDGTLGLTGTRAVVVGGGTMGADVAVVLLRGGLQVTVIERHAERREGLVNHVAERLAPLDLGHCIAGLDTVAALEDAVWPEVGLVIECIPEQLPLKQALFSELVTLAPPGCLLTSNSSSFPISAIAASLESQARMFGLHFFMPAHLVPLVEVVLGPQSDGAGADVLSEVMRGCGMVPVRVRKDKPGFLANRLQHALAREAFALIDEGVATAEDVDAAVRFGFGFRFLAAGPVLQRDHAGLDVHCAAAATMYPSLSNTDRPAAALRERVEQGRLGMKSGGGFFDWPHEKRLAERKRYDDLLRQGLALLADELPPLRAQPKEST